MTRPRAVRITFRSRRVVRLPCVLLRTVMRGYYTFTPRGAVRMLADHVEKFIVAMPRVDKTMTYPII